MKIIIILCFLAAACNITGGEKKVDGFKLGNEMLVSEKKELIEGKRIGLIINQSGINSQGKLFLDVLAENHNVVKVFSPEHGLRGDDNTNSGVDSQTGIKLVSLYGNKKEPDASDLADVDVLVYDMQDAGARFYTYVNTMYYSMKAASSQGKKFIVCDRPVIANPNYTDGFMLDEDVKSFIGLLDIPIAYGMTCGELAKYINQEMIGGACDLEVVQMNGYTRNTDYQSLGLAWVRPSPSMYFATTAVCYQGTCLFEGTNFAEGRGTDKPFEYVGAPYCDGQVLADELNSYGLSGVVFEPINFTPTSISSPSNPPKYVGENCGGVYVKVTDKKSFQPVVAGIAILTAVKKLFPGFKFRNDNFIDKLSGTKDFRAMVNQGLDYNAIVQSYATELNEFRGKREQYLIYK